MSLCGLMHLCLYLLGRHLAFGSQLGGFEAYCVHLCVCVCEFVRACTDMSGGGEVHKKSPARSLERQGTCSKIKLDLD